MRKLVVIAAVVAMVAALGAEAVCAKDKQASKGMAAVERAAKAKKYLFIFFYSDDAEQTASMRSVFDKAVGNLPGKPARVEVKVTDPAEAEIIDKYSVRGAPMPLALAIAPNGAITGGYAAPFTEEQIAGSMVTPCTQASMKALQENKAVILCIQNRNTTLNDAAMKGVKDLRADPTYAASTEIVTLDPSDPAEAKLLGALAIDPKIDQAQTVCLLPPGQAVAKLAGATTKEMIVKSLTVKSGGCCPGGAGASKGCGPAAGQPGASKPPATGGTVKTGGK